MLKRDVLWLELALSDMHEIADYLAKHDTKAAQRVVQAIWDASQSLAVMPSRGRAGRVPETRELVLTQFPYFLAYRVIDNKVQILRVLHTSRKYVQ